MKKIFLGFLIFLTTNAWAGSVPGANTIPTLTIGPRVFTDLSSNLIVLIGRFSSATNRYSTLYKTGGIAYTPSGSKQFICDAAYYQIDVGVASGHINAGSCDNIVGEASTTAPVNPAYFNGLATSYAWYAGTAGDFSGPCPLVIPNLKYGFIDDAGNAQSGVVIVYGHEQ